MDVDATARIMTKLFERIWKEEKVPDEWLKGIITKIPKKGDRTVCDNCRGVTLLNIAFKIFARCIFERIQGPIEETLRKNQAGFRRGRSCADQIFVLRKLLEQSVEYQKALIVNFVDFEKAFDSVFREALWGYAEAIWSPRKDDFSDKITV